MSQPVTVYSKPNCPYCVQAKLKLEQQGYEIDLRDVMEQSVLHELKQRAPNVRTAPQIFVGSYHIGGYQELIEAMDNQSLKMLVES